MTDEVLAAHLNRIAENLDEIVCLLRNRLPELQSHATERTAGLTLAEAVKVARPDQKLRRKSCTGIHLSTASGYNVLQLMDAVADDWEIVP